ncbi:protein shisa-5-like [Micropterus dolomieu]|uniref:protein shisa-5-like n=1 Tax=Micropterus dolomieu TaxID=147949 RepID=UPI001E8D4A04|nr:protein shisa-5-like [Micropterus dolomieu]
MASGLSSVVVLALCVTLAPYVSAGDDCQSYTDEFNQYKPSLECSSGFCCGDCTRRYCCHQSIWRFSEDKQERCKYSRFNSQGPQITMIVGICGFVVFLLIVICCCVCPCCCLYKMCRKPRPVVTTTTHTTVVTTSPQQYPQQYPQQPTATPGQPQSYQGAQYPPYQPIPVQTGYGAQPMPQGYGPQPLPTSPYHGQGFIAPPPSYQEATGPCYPPNPMPYSQAAFTPGQPAYPMQPPVQPQPNAPPAHADYLTQPAYNPDFVAPPLPKTG